MSTWHRYFFILIFFNFFHVIAYGRNSESLSWSGVLDSIRGNFSDVRHLPIHGLADWLDDNEQRAPLIFDTRSSQEYAVSHLKNAQHLAPGTNLEAFLENVEKAYPIVVYCSVGYRSAIVASKLQKIGFSRVYNLEGSIFAWVNNGYPIVKGTKAAKYVHPFNSYWGSLLREEFRYVSNSKNYGWPEIRNIENVNHYKSVTFVGGLMFFLLWESFFPFMIQFRKNLMDRGRHGVRNLIMGGINAVAIALLFVLIWMWAAEWADRNGFGVLNWLSLSPWLHTLGAIALFDIFTYWFHRLSHSIPFFWRFHRVHHSDQKMDVTTANRFHIGEIVLSSLLRIPAILVFGAHLWELLLYELIMFPIVQFHHANIGLPERLDKILRVFIVTPAMHKVHHSRIKPETNSNYTSLLSVWDRVFQSFNLRSDTRDISFGLDELDETKHQTLAGLLKTPVVDIKDNK